MVQKEDSSYYFKELNQFKKTAKIRLNENLVQLDTIQKMHAGKGKELQPELGKALTETQRKIAILLKRLDEFNEEGKDSAEKFIRDVQKEMVEIDKSIKAFKSETVQT